MKQHQSPTHSVAQAGTSEDATDVDVLVIGAGPTGLVAAAEALRHGLTVRIMERNTQRGMFSKALVVHARTMEVFAIMGIDRDIRAAGTPFAALNLHFNNRNKRVRVDLLDQPWGDTAYPFWLSVPQHDTERVLENHLTSLGGQVEWSCSLLELTDQGNVVEATLSHGEETEIVRARWVIGCDGGRSTVRDQAGITLRRTGAGATFLLADVKTTCDLVENEGHLFLAPDGLLILVPMPEPRQWRLIARVATAKQNTSTTEAEDTLAPADAARIDELIAERAGITFGAHDVSWTSQFDLSHGVAGEFRSGRIFLAGDAAHIHSPVGGQGLNTGVQDAQNLLWRIAEARHVSPEHAEELLAAYQIERRGTAAAMVDGVARMTAIMTSPKYLADRFRSLVAPLVVSRSFIQAKLARGVGMLNLSYAKQRGERGAGTWSVGHRLPNPLLGDGERLYDRIPNSGFSWVVCVNGTEQPNIAAAKLDADAPRWRGRPVIVLNESDLAEPDTSVRSGRAVLVRPDRYIAAVGPSGGTMPITGAATRFGEQANILNLH